MASAAMSDAGPGWIATALGVLVLVVTGFLAGLLVGIVGQEPELVAGHLVGRSEVVDWSPEPLPPLADSDLELPPVSAGLEAEAGEGELIVPSPLQRETRAPAPAVEVPAIQVPAGGGYAIQVGAFAEGEAAESLASTLSAKGFPAYVTPSAGDSAQRWRVRVGPVETRSEADTIARRLKRDEQLPTWVLSPAAR